MATLVVLAGILFFLHRAWSSLLVRLWKSMDVDEWIRGCLVPVCSYGNLSERERRKGFEEVLEIEVLIYREKTEKWRLKIFEKYDRWSLRFEIWNYFYCFIEVWVGYDKMTGFCIGRVFGPTERCHVKWYLYFPFFPILLWAGPMFNKPILN